MYILLTSMVDIGPFVGLAIIGTFRGYHRILILFCLGSCWGHLAWLFCSISVWMYLFFYEGYILNLNLDLSLYLSLSLSLSSGVSEPLPFYHFTPTIRLCRKWWRIFVLLLAACLLKGKFLQISLLYLIKAFLLTFKRISYQNICKHIGRNFVGCKMWACRIGWP